MTGTAGRNRTIASYGAHAQTYRDRTRALPDSVRQSIATFAELLGPGERVLEIGSGGGRDAEAMEAAGLSVRRTDVTAEFVALLRNDGREADVLDPLDDDLTDPASPERRYDGVWSNACLHHVRRADLPTVLTRLRSVTRTGGPMYLSVEEGAGEEWTSTGNVEAPRLFVYWNQDSMRSALESAGWQVREITVQGSAPRQRWLHVLAFNG